MTSQLQSGLHRYSTSSHSFNFSPANEQPQAGQDLITSASSHCSNPESEGGPCTEAVAGKGEWKGRMDGAEGWGGDEGDVGRGVIFFFFLFFKKVFLSRETAAQTIFEEVGKGGGAGAAAETVGATGGQAATAGTAAGGAGQRLLRPGLRDSRRLPRSRSRCFSSGCSRRPRQGSGGYRGAGGAATGAGAPAAEAFAFAPL